MNRKLYIDIATRLLNPFARELMPTVGDRGITEARVTSVNAEKRQVSGILSTPTIDRYGEIVLPEAFKDSLPRFMQNPKFLGGHQSNTFDGSPTSIGHWIDMKVTNDALIGTAQFLPAGDELADKWWFRFQHGAQRSFSVGFIAQEFMMKDVEVDGVKRKIRHFTKADLLEVSAVELPANADALLLAAQGGGTRGKVLSDDAEDEDERSQDVGGKLSNRQLAIATRALTPVIRDIIRTELSADPYTGVLGQLVGDIARVVLDLQNQRGCGHADHGHAYHDDSSGVHDEDLNEALTTILAGKGKRPR